MQKCYAVTIEDKAQDIGLDVIENIARFNRLEGIVFNDEDGSMKAVIRGDNSVISDFFDEIEVKGSKRGIVLDVKEKRELELDIPLPPIFTKVSTDDDIDIGRKLDIGNDRLDDISGKLTDIRSDTKKNTELLTDVRSDTKKNTELLTDIRSLLGKLVGK